jgi:hypothetical protein
VVHVIYLDEFMGMPDEIAAFLCDYPVIDPAKNRMIWIGESGNLMHPLNYIRKYGEKVDYNFVKTGPHRNLRHTGRTPADLYWCNHDICTFKLVAIAEIELSPADQQILIDHSATHPTKRKKERKPMGLDHLSNDTRKQLEAQAADHSTFESFAQWLDTMGRMLWQGDRPSDLSGNAINEFITLMKRNHTEQSFRAEMAQYAELVWHNHRANADVPAGDRHLTDTEAPVEPSVLQPLEEAPAEEQVAEVSQPSWPQAGED